MTGISQYKTEEIRYVLKAIVKKIKLSNITEGFQARFHKRLNPNQIRYIKNKYGKDPAFKSPMINYRGGNAADLEDSDNPQEDQIARVNLPLPSTPEIHRTREQSQSHELLASQNLIQSETSGSFPQTITKGHEMSASLVSSRVQGQEQGIHFQLRNQMYHHPQDLNIPSQIPPAESDFPQETLVPTVQANNIASTHLGWIPLPPSNFPYYPQLPSSNNAWGQGTNLVYPGTLSSSPVFVTDNTMPIPHPSVGYYGNVETNSQGFNYAIHSPRFVNGSSMNQYAVSALPDSMWMNAREPSPLHSRVSATSTRRDRRHNPYSRPAVGTNMRSTYVAVPRPPSRVVQESVSSPLLTHGPPPLPPHPIQGSVGSSPRPTYIPPQSSSSKKVQASATSSPRPESSVRTRRRIASGLGRGIPNTMTHLVASQPAIPISTPSLYNGVLGNLASNMGQGAVAPAEPLMPYPPITQDQRRQNSDGHFEESNPELAVDSIARHSNCPLIELGIVKSKLRGSPSTTKVGLSADSQLTEPPDLAVLGDSPTPFVPVKTSLCSPSASPFFPAPPLSQAITPKPEYIENNGEKKKWKGKEKEISSQVLDIKEGKRQQEFVCRQNIQTAMNQMLQRHKTLHQGGQKQEATQVGISEQSLPRDQGESQSQSHRQSRRQAHVQNCTSSQSQAGNGHWGPDTAPHEQIDFEAATPTQSSNSISFENLKSWVEAEDAENDGPQDTLLVLNPDAPHQPN